MRANVVLRVSLLSHASQCFDLGFHLSLGKVLRTYLAAESRAQAAWQQGLCTIEGAIDALDPLGDKSRLMEANPAAYCPPLCFDYQPHEGDEVRGWLLIPGSL